MPETAATPEQQTCGRRMSDGGPWERVDGVDRWEASGHGLVGQHEAGRSWRTGGWRRGGPPPWAGTS